MDPQFWHDRWADGQIGFHEGKVNGYLFRFISELEAPRGASVFVPLCGKGVDMRWITEQGLRVVGVELSPIAVAAFFEENELVPQRSRQGPFERWEGGGVCILCGDFFDLRPEDLDGTAVVYDRAALVALPPAQRERYARRMAELLPARARILLVTLVYPQAEMDGPPFSVPEDEVRRIYDWCADIRVLDGFDVLAENPRFRDKGLSCLEEKGYLLTRE